MKRLVLTIMAIGLLGQYSCMNEEKKIVKRTEQTAENLATSASEVQQATDNLINPGEIAADIPEFSDADVQKFAEDYSDYFNSLMDAAKKGDAEKIQEMTTKGDDWAKKASEYTQKMNDEDKQKFLEWSSKLQSAAAGR